jgi:hypothetical protein
MSKKQDALVAQRRLLWYLELQMMWMSELEREPPDWPVLKALDLHLRSFERKWGRALPQETHAPARRTRRKKR